MVQLLRTWKAVWISSQERKILFDSPILTMMAAKRLTPVREQRERFQRVQRERREKGVVLLLKSELKRKM